MAAAGKSDPAAAPPEGPAAAKGVFMRRIFPFLLAANIFIGAAALSSPASATAKTAEPTPPPKRVLPPISGDEQRQVYKWMLEEKRKIKPSNAAEKNKINEEKALLKEFIRAESLPSLL